MRVTCAQTPLYVTKAGLVPSHSPDHRFWLSAWTETQQGDCHYPLRTPLCWKREGGALPLFTTPQLIRDEELLLVRMCLPDFVLRPTLIHRTAVSALTRIKTV